MFVHEHALVLQSRPVLRIIGPSVFRREMWWISRAPSNKAKLKSSLDSMYA